MKKPRDRELGLVPESYAGKPIGKHPADHSEAELTDAPARSGEGHRQSCLQACFSMPSSAMAAA